MKIVSNLATHLRSPRLRRKVGVPPSRPTKHRQYLKLQVTKYKSYESENSDWVEGQSRYLTREFGDVSRDANIADISCGDGVGLRFFRQNGFTNVVGVEYCEDKVRIARKYGFTVESADFHDLSCFQNASFDFVYSSHSLEHAFMPRQVLSEFHRILKSSGVLKLVLPYPDAGPIDAHVAKFELGTVTHDDGAALSRFLEESAFRVGRIQFDSFREDEIWITAHKVERK